MGNTFRQIAAIWKKLGPNQKVTLLLLAVGIVAGVVTLAVVARRPSYELLYADLEEKDMAQVVAFLKESKVPYRILQGGRAVMVPEGSKYDLRLAVSSKGILTGGRVGLELWDAPGWGASPMAEQMMRRRSLQGELARTIMHLEPVSWADVQIAQPEPSFFAEDEKPVTAAITVRLHPGRTLSPAQIAGICRLVASSVEGLQPDNVTIIDDQGNLLSTPRTDPVNALASDLQQLQRQYEDYLAAKAQTLLDRALGPGRSVVRVNAVLDMDRISETRETYDANGRVALTERIASKSIQGEAGAGGAQSDETTEATYTVPKTIRTIQNVPGGVKQIHVAVLLDPTFRDAEGKEQQLTQEQIDNLGQVVRRAVGVDESRGRGDTFQLATMSFREPTRSDLDSKAEKEQKNQYILTIVKRASSLLAVAVFVVFAALALRRISRTIRSAGASTTSPTFPLDLAGMPGGNGLNQLRNHVREVMARDPVAAAQLLRRWLNEEEGARRG